MPTDPEQGRLLQPLLKRRPDLGYSNHMVFFRPFTHYLRGVIFSQGWISGDLTVWSMAYQLYLGDWWVPESHNRLQLHYRYPGSAWKTNKEQFSEDLCDRIERDFLPVVEGMNDPRAHEQNPPYLAFYSEKDKPLKGPTYRFRFALGACYYGNFDAAAELLAPLWTDFLSSPEGPVTDEFRYHQDMFWRAAYLGHLLKTDRRRIPALLQDWERHIVHLSKLSAHWIRTPFPCEQQ